MAEILIIEDEKDIAQAIEYNLKRESFKVVIASDGLSGLKKIREKRPDLLILDLMLPGIDGLDVCRRLKNDPAIAGIPIIILTAKAEETDRVVGLELGADDYITKPFSLKELVARVKVVLRRLGQQKEINRSSIHFPDLEIDPDRHEVKVLGKKVVLTAKEFQLLEYLARNKEKVYSRDRLLDAVWGVEVAIETRTVDVHMRRLREKLGKAGKHLITLRGVGYKFV
ncbi:response regulator transcription factor [Candidatus Saganbacteria bacterium]|nr:response regulator transcription factor [Candidatus Saganbacteria bacterium]